GFIQTARTGNTYSVNSGYKGTSNAADYDNVVYLRDGGGNINFATNPTATVTSYNGTETPTIDSKDIKWADPMDTASLVQMSNDLTDAEYGLMPSGKKVKLKTATRSQHFAIADDLYSNSRTGTWTWHHLSEKYKMILVDMRVHAKHGHNGGVLLWNK
nr:HNH endonuclease [Anaerolineae bacterium]